MCAKRCVPWSRPGRSGARSVRAVALAGALVAIPPHALAQEILDGLPASWTRATEPFRIADGLYYVGSDGLPAYLLTSDAGHVLVDGPMEENVGLVLANIRALGFEPTDVRVQLASHTHYDHVGGIAALVDSTGAELVLSAPAADVMASGGRSDVLEGMVTFRPARAARTIGHLDTVTVGSITLTAHLTPGHTRGCTSWSGRVAVEGQPVTFVSVCSLTVLPPYRLLGDDATYPGIAEDYCRSIAHLRSLEPDVFLAVHGSWYDLHGKRRALEGGDPRAFVDPEGYRRYLDDALRQVEARLASEGHRTGCAGFSG